MCMNWQDFPQRHPKRMKIRELSKSAYDSWVIPLPIDQLDVAIRCRPKYYGNILTSKLVDFIYSQLVAHDPLFGELSPEVFKSLRTSISFEYGAMNRMDFKEGGDGMLVPTFIDIIHGFLFSVREWKKMQNKADHLVYAKYFWAFDLKCELIGKYLTNDEPKKKAS
jgi:hypothetical protein